MRETQANHDCDVSLNVKKIIFYFLHERALSGLNQSAQLSPLVF